MNLNKFTKAELISKFKKLDDKNQSNQNNQSIFSKIINLIITFKSILLKLTFISLLIRIFFKYSIFRRIWSILNTIVMSIFGISLLDNFGIEFISNFFNEIKIITYSIITYLSNTQFYTDVAGLFSNKDIPSNTTTSKNRTIISESNIEKTRNDSKIGQSNRNSKISEWLKPATPEPEIPDESSNTKYYIIAGMIIFCCIAWYYSDDIKTGGVSIIEWIRSFRPRPGDDPNDGTRNIGDNIRADNTMNLKSRLKRFFNRENDLEMESDRINLAKERLALNNSSQTTIKPIELENQVASSSEIITYVTGLSEIKANNFYESTNNVLREIDHFLNQKETFPVLAVQQGLYKLLRERLYKLSEIDPKKYDKLLNNPAFNNRVEQFLEIEKDIFPNNTYDAVAKATELEQDHWSDRANSPSPKVLSPVHDSISQVMSPDMATYAIEDQQMHDYRKELITNKDFQQGVKENWDKMTENILENERGPSQLIEENPKLDKGKQKEQLPQIEIDSGSDESMKHYFPEPKVTQDEVKSGFASLYDSIKSKKGSSIPSSPRISQVGLQPNIDSVQEIVSEQPSSLLEQIKGGKSLRKTETNVKEKFIKGKEVNAEASSSDDRSIIGSLKHQLSKLRKAVDAVDDGENVLESSSYWENTPKAKDIELDENTNTPKLDKGKAKAKDIELDDNTNAPKLDKGKAKEIYTDESMNQYFRDPEEVKSDNKITDSSSNNPLNLSPTGADLGIGPLDDSEDNSERKTILNNFWEKLKTSRNTPISSPNISSTALNPELSPLKTLKGLSPEIKSFSELEIEHKEELAKIINETKDLDSEGVINRLKEEFPNSDQSGYKESFMKAVEAEIATGKTEAEQEKIRRQFIKADLLELQETGNSVDVRALRNILRENYTHNSLLDEIKNVTQSSRDIESQEESSYAQSSSSIDQRIADSKAKAKK
jgi:hypothetical protein